MLRLLFIQTFAAMGRGRLHTVVTLVGLALALAAALVIALFVHQQYSYERFIPGHERVFRMVGTVEQPGQAVRVSPRSPVILAGAIAAQAKSLAEGTARMLLDAPLLRAGEDRPLQREANFAWVDPSFFKVMPLPAVAGNPATALAKPGSVVLTRSAAQRLFGSEDMLGKALFVRMPDQPGQFQRLEVTALLEDLPAQTHLTTQIYAAGQTAGSPLAKADAAGSPMADAPILTYVRGAPGTTAASLQPALEAVLAPFQEMAKASGTKLGGAAVPISEIQFGPVADVPGAKPTVERRTIAAIGLIGAIIVAMASVSYVSLTTARSASRAGEVATRKALGASRWQLVLQFLGESLVHVVLALIAAAALVELTLPLINAALGTELSFNLLHEPVLAAELAGFALVLALAAGIVPALVLSAIRPAAALSGGSSGTGHAALLRHVTVSAQFALMIVLMITALTMLSQTRFAFAHTLSDGKKPILMLDADCSTPIADLLRDADEVGWATCAAPGAFNLGPQGAVTLVDAAGRRHTPGMVDVDAAFFKAMDIPLIAGRSFEPGPATAHTIVINETAARHFGFADPQAAVGQTMGFSLDVGEAPATEPVRIIGVVADRSESVLAPANALIYQNWLRGPGVAAMEAPGYLYEPVHRAIEAVWQRVGGEGPPDLKLFSELERERYRTLTVLGRAAAFCAALAAVIAGMGLFALSAFTAQQRRREVGIRKALGADTRAIARLFALGFARPLVVAGVVALPLGYLAAQHWLASFAAHVAVTPLLLAGVLAGSLLFALAITAWHVLSLARMSPADALRI